ncbi:MAG: hypothetical protein RL596_1518 [Bacteroidota bacterium]
MKQVKWALIFFVFIAIGCTSSKQTVIAVWSNQNKQVYGVKRSVFIMVLAASPQNRNELEASLKEAAVARGLKVTTSIEALGPMNVGKNFPADAILAKVKELGYESIFTVAVKDVKKESTFIQATDNFYNPMGYYGGAYGIFGNYYNNYWMHPGVAFGFGGGFTPSYTSEKITIFLESNLYETSTQELLLSIKSKAVNPNNMIKESKIFTKHIVAELNEQKKLAKL